MEAARALPAWPSSAVPRARGSSIRREIWLRATQKVPRRRRPSAGSRSSSAAPRRSRARSAWPSTAPLRTSQSGTSSAGATRSIRTSSSPRERRGASPWFALPCSGVAKQVEQLEQVTIRFAGDSGDGMQLTGGRFTSETALVGNDLSTLPDFPAEIRAPAGSLPGVSGFQLHFADHDILTPGDAPDVLVAMNPAALKTNLRDLPKGGTLIVNRDAFTDRNLDKAGYASNPLEVGLVAASVKSGLPLFLGAYPITPASGILEDLSRHKRFGVRTFQAEDEIAAVGAALGASFGGALGVCTSSGPGVVLKAETVGLAVALELPLLILDIQRAGPSTGMPTKPEQADLLMVLFGRNSESPVPVVAAATPAGCFDMAIEAARIAIKYRTPVFLLSDAYLANGSEPWLIPDVGDLPDISTSFASEPNDGDRFLPYKRDPETLARPWAIPGTPGLEHRIGGLEKGDETGNVSD